MDSAQFDTQRETALVAAFRAGDPVATRTIEERLQAVPNILTAMNRRLGRPLDDHEIADLAQDTAVIVLRKIDEAIGRAPFRAWLLRVCNLELRNGIRRKRKRPAGLHPELPVEERRDAIADLERREVVMAGLAQIQSIDAEAVYLRHLEGLAFVDIAERLEITENTAKGRYYRGIQQLQKVMRNQDPNRQEIA